MLLQMAADFSAFTLILIFGLIFLFRQHDLKSYEIVASIILFGLTLGLCSVLLLGLWRPESLRSLLGWFRRQVNRLGALFKRPEIITESWVEKNASEFAQAAAAIAAHPAGLVRIFLFVMAAHLLDVMTLYVVFLAFRQPIQFGALITGYAMGILFLIVSITPMGIGVVEAVMALVFTSLGIPAPIATTISLAYRGLTFWLPVVLGFFLLQRVKSFSSSERSIAENGSVKIVALLTALMGVINVLSAVTPALANRMALLERYSPLVVRAGSHLTAALAGFALLILSTQLWRRKRVAWLLTMIILAMSVISHLVKGLDYEEALLSVALGVWLWVLRYEFHARSDRASVQQGLRLLAAALLFSLAYGVLGFYLLDHHYRVNFNFLAAVRQTLVMFTQFYDPGLEPITGFGRYFADSIYLVSAITIGYAIVMIIRPVLIREKVSPADRARATEIVQSYGRSSFARLTLLDDKRYFFSAGGAVVAYGIKGRVAVSLGDPIGSPQETVVAISEFKNFCNHNDWLPAFYQVFPDYLEGYQRERFECLCLGHEAIVHLDRFSMEGKTGKPLRTATNRLTREGYEAIFHHPPIADELLRELRAVSDEWLTMVHGSEKRFGLGWFDDDYIRNGPVAAIHGPGGEVTAFTNLIPEYQCNEATIDLMRRRREVVPGTMDYLFAAIFQWSRSQGYDTFNLGLSPLSGVGEHSGDPVIERALHYIYKNINQFYNFQGLHEFKEKFNPEWSPRYLIYPGITNLAAVEIALSRLSSGDDFIWGYLNLP
jgi:phosphatidylglycerol lysyltransferase